MTNHDWLPEILSLWNNSKVQSCLPILSIIFQFQLNKIIILGNVNDKFCQNNKFFKFRLIHNYVTIERNTSIYLSIYLFVRI